MAARIYTLKGTPLEDRFWSKVNKNGPVPAHRPDLGPCWLWTACLSAKGYGQFKADGRMRHAHTISWEMKNGPMPDGLVPDHLCRVRSCVNEAHLEAVTNAENVRRGDSGKYLREKTHCPSGHPYAGENIYITPAGERICRQCQRDAQRRYNAKKSRPPRGSYQRAKVICPQGHPYSGDNLYVDKKGKRYCKTCMSRYSAAYKAKKRAGNVVAMTPDIK